MIFYGDIIRDAIRKTGAKAEVTRNWLDGKGRNDFEVCANVLSHKMVTEIYQNLMEKGCHIILVPSKWKWEDRCGFRRGMPVIKIVGYYSEVDE